MENEVKNEEVTKTITRAEESKKEKGNKKGRGPLYWIIVVVGVAAIVYLSIGIGEKLSKVANPIPSTNEESNSNENKDSNETSNSNSNEQSNVTNNSNSNEQSNVTNNSNINTTTQTTDAEIKNFDAAKTTNGLNDSLHYALLYDDSSLEENLLENDTFRNNVVISSLNAKTVTGQTNKFYVTYTEFVNKHQEFFGTNYQVKMANTNGNAIWTVEESINNDVILTAKAIKYNELTKTYVITGEWKQKHLGGNFAVEYNVVNGNRYLKSVKLGTFSSKF